MCHKQPTLTDRPRFFPLLLMKSGRPAVGAEVPAVVSATRKAMAHGSSVVQNLEHGDRLGFCWCFFALNRVGVEIDVEPAAVCPARMGRIPVRLL